VHEGNNNGMHRAADAFGLYFASKGHFNQAYKVLHRSMRFYERTDNPSYLMKAYHYLGTLFLNWGNTNEAIHWFEKCRSLAKNNPMRSSFHSVNNNLALVNFNNKNFEKGKKFLDSNYPEIFMMNDELKANFYNLLGNYYMSTSNRDSVSKYYDLSLYHSKKTKNNRIISSAFTNNAIFQFGIDEKLSYQLFDSSLVYAIKSKFPDRISQSLYNIAFWHYSFNDFENAIFNFEQSYNFAKENNSYTHMIDALEELLVIYRENEEWEKVDMLHERIISIKNAQHKEIIEALNEIDNFENIFKISTSNSNGIYYETVFSNKKQLKIVILIILIQFVIIVVLAYKLSLRSNRLG